MKATETQLLNPIQVMLRLYKDEPDLSGSFIVCGYEWIGKIWPRSDEYRIVEYGSGRKGLQAKINGSFTDVLFYDDGYDDHGKLFRGRWKQLSDACKWSTQSLKLLRNELLGIPETIKILS